MLEMINIKKSFNGSDHVFDGINLKVGNKSIVELAGNNGIGKSTLLNIIGGMTSFDGTIKLNSISLKENFKEYIKEVSLIGNIPFLYDFLTPHETIKMILSFLNMKEIDPSLVCFMEEIGFDRYRNILTRELSLGTKQKLSLILALMSSPRLLLLDEPFVNFDSSSRDKAIRYLKNYITKHNTILIYATHSTDTYLNGFPNKKIILKRDVQLDKVVLEEENA